MNLDEQVLLKKISKGAIIVFAGFLIAYTLEYSCRIIMARWLGPSGYGIIALCLSFIGIISTLTMLSFEDTITRYISYLKDEGKRKSLLNFIFKISTVLSAIASVLVYYFAENISMWFNNSELAIPLKIFSISIPFYALLKISVSCFRGLQLAKYKLYFSDIFFSVSRVVLVVFFLLFGYGIVGAAFGYVIAIILSGTLAFLFLERKLISIRTKQLLSKTDMVDMFRFSWPIMLISLFNISYANLGTIFLGIFKMSSDVGIYNASLPTAGILSFVLTSFLFLFMPVIAELYAKKNMTAISSLFDTITRLTFVLTFPLFLIFLVFPEKIISIMFGDAYVGAALSLAILSIGIFISAITGPAGSIFIAIGKTKLALFYFLIITISNIILSIALIPSYGVTGAAMAASIAIILGNVWCLIALGRFVKIKPFTTYNIKYIFAGLTSMILTYGIYKLLSQSSIIVFGLILIFYLMVYLILLRITKSFTEEDIFLLNAVKRKILS
ncbi:MAG: oligosaccharide flippase family protein [Nanoarchaeota archaeon]|nr:oligosaccharide flippase family protein [Nanoarchaeota archaeon]MBU4124208.1 oligosaccharide flippase family protein [Nanoarchaeota archaeon]